MRGEKNPRKVKEAVPPKRPVSVASEETGRICSEINGLLLEFDKTVEIQRKELERIKACTRSGEIEEFDRKTRELLGRLENTTAEVKAGLDELHRTLGKFEEKVRYKDEAERELQTLDEEKVMLNNKLGGIMRRIENLKVRKGSNLIKLFAEAKEVEEEVRRSGEETLDFEREYTRFLSMMGKFSG
jgi:chromosome segregation ATPase